MLSSRTKFLIQNLKTLGYEKSLKALKMMINEMNSENGFARHDGSHYYHHLVDVTQTLINFGVRDESTITAAILHDYIEDVEGVTEKMINSHFGSEVAHIVALLTKKRDVDYHTNQEEMNIYLDKILENQAASLIKTADRIHNFSSMRAGTSFNHKIKQVQNTKKYFIPFFKKCRNEYVEFSNFFFHAKTIIEPIMYEIEEENKLRLELADLKAKMEEKNNNEMVFRGNNI